MRKENVSVDSVLGKMIDRERESTDNKDRLVSSSRLRDYSGISHGNGDDDGKASRSHRDGDKGERLFKTLRNFSRASPTFFYRSEVKSMTGRRSLCCPFILRAASDAFHDNAASDDMLFRFFRH